MLKIWGRRNSAHTQRVLWLCEEASLPYELILASATMGPDGHISGGGSAFGVVDTPAYRAMNPNGTIPTRVARQVEAHFRAKGTFIREADGPHQQEDDLEEGGPNKKRGRPDTDKRRRHVRTGLYNRPVGRAPRGKEWDRKSGRWISIKMKPPDEKPNENNQQ